MGKIVKGRTSLFSKSNSGTFVITNKFKRIIKEAFKMFSLPIFILCTYKGNDKDKTNKVKTNKSSFTIIVLKICPFFYSSCELGPAVKQETAITITGTRAAPHQGVHRTYSYM